MQHVRYQVASSLTLTDMSQPTLGFMHFDDTLHQAGKNPELASSLWHFEMCTRVVENLEIGVFLHESSLDELGDVYMNPNSFHFYCDHRGLTFMCLQESGLSLYNSFM